MISMLDALYRCAAEQEDLTHWLANSDLIREYREMSAHARELEETLTTSLPEPGRTEFGKFVDNVTEQEELERQMLFCQGLAMGLRLGMLVLRA